MGLEEMGFSERTPRAGGWALPEGLQAGGFKRGVFFGGAKLVLLPVGCGLPVVLFWWLTHIVVGYTVMFVLISVVTLHSLAESFFVPCFMETETKRRRTRKNKECP